MIERLDIEEIKPSSRRYPAIIFDQEREAGDQILSVDNLSCSIGGELLFKDIHLNLAKKDKVIIYSKDTRAVSSFYDIIAGASQSYTGQFNWGITTNQAYLPADHEFYFHEPISLVDWLRQYAKTEEEKEEVFLRGFLGKCSLVVTKH